MNTEARRKASAAYHAKRTAEGWRKVTIWLHDDTRAELAEIAKAMGCSKDDVVNSAINHYRDEARRRQAAALRGS